MAGRLSLQRWLDNIWVKAIQQAEYERDKFCGLPAVLFVDSPNQGLGCEPTRLPPLKFYIGNVTTKRRKHINNFNCLFVEEEGQEYDDILLVLLIRYLTGQMREKNFPLRIVVMSSDGRFHPADDERFLSYARNGTQNFSFYFTDGLEQRLLVTRADCESLAPSHTRIADILFLLGNNIYHNTVKPPGLTTELRPNEICPNAANETTRSRLQRTQWMLAHAMRLVNDLQRERQFGKGGGL